MEIELPDGTVLEAPDGADVKSVVKGYRRQQLVAQNPTEYDPNSPQYKEKYGTETSAPVAFFSGVKRIDAGMGNIARKYGGYTMPGIMGKLASKYTSDENLEQMDTQDKELKQQHPLARIGGEVAATIPMSMATGGTSTALGAAGTVGRYLANPYARAAVEGALSSAAAAPVGEQGEGAAKGAALSMAMQAMFGLGGRAVRGLIQKSKEMQNLEQIFGQHGEKIQAPISQAAGDQDIVTRLGKSFYQESLPLIPGVRGKLERQAQEGLEKTRELAMREATPSGTTLAADAGANVGESLHTLRSAIEEGYDETVGSYAFNVPEKFKKSVAKTIIDSVKDVDKTTVKKISGITSGLMKRFSSGEETISGANLLKVKNALARVKVAPEEQAALKAAQQHIENLIEEELKQGGVKGNLRDLARYKDLAEPTERLAGIEAAAHAARVKAGNFSMADLARNSKDQVLRDIGATGNAVFGQPATKTSLTGRILAGAGIGGFGAYMSPVAAGGALLGGNIMATKAFQRAMMGDTAAQEALKLFLSQHPEMAAQLASIMKSGAATQVE